MGLLADFVAAILPYTLYLVVAVVVVVIFAAVKDGLAGGTTAGIFWLAVTFGLVGIWLLLTGYLEYSLMAFGLAALIGILDGLHERRLTRRGHARMRG